MLNGKFLYYSSLCELQISELDGAVMPKTLQQNEQKGIQIHTVLIYIVFIF